MLIPAVSRIGKEWKTGKVLRLNIGEFVGSKAKGLQALEDSQMLQAGVR